MFKYYCQCYNNCFNPSPENAGAYIDISNETYTPIYFIVQYSVDVRTFTKQSPIFCHGQSQRIQVSHNAINICFNVINSSTDPHEVIFNVALEDRRRHCYKLIQTPSGFELIEISC